jgi:hypothetical protein
MTTAAFSDGVRPLGTFSDYDGMLAAMRARVRELQIKGEDFDADRRAACAADWHDIYGPIVRRARHLLHYPQGSVGDGAIEISAAFTQRFIRAPDVHTARPDRPEMATNPKTRTDGAMAKVK